MIFSHYGTGTFHLFTPTRPLLLGDNRSLVFAPFNTSYVPMTEHLLRAKLLPESRGSSGQQDWPENRWNEPHDLDIQQDGDDAYKLMDPENFFPFAVPVNDLEEDNLIDDNKEGPQKNITPIPLPQEFKKSLIKKSSNVDELRELIKSPLIKQAENSSPNANKIGGDHANEDMENELEAAVQEKFREWLLSSGQLREIADLIGLEKTQKN